MLEKIFLTVDLEDLAKREEGSRFTNTMRASVNIVCEVNTVRFRGKPHLKYKNVNAIRYARKWCSKKQNSCGVYFQGEKRSDCAHFLAHCLHEGGITIKHADGPDDCTIGLTARVKVIVEALKALSKKYANIYPVSYDEGIMGDPAFHEVYYVRPSHAVLISETRPIPNDPGERETLYYAHSTERCGKVAGDLQWYKNFGDAFRIVDAR